MALGTATRARQWYSRDPSQFFSSQKATVFAPHLRPLTSDLSLVLASERNEVVPAKIANKLMHRLACARTLVAKTESVANKPGLVATFL